MNVLGRPSELAHRPLKGRLTASGQVYVKLRKIEHAVIGVTLGAVPVISGFLAGWWISVPLVPESRIYQFALAGLCSESSWMCSFSVGGFKERTR